MQRDSINLTLANRRILRVEAVAVVQLADQDIVLIDTAGRSPRDEIQLQELRAMLQEAQVDEVHLVLSAVAATSHLTRAVHSFGSVGTTSLLLTKLDEADGLGNLVPLVRSGNLPLSYLGCGQSVPDDIVVAEKQKLVRARAWVQGNASRTYSGSDIFHPYFPELQSQHVTCCGNPWN